MNICIDIGNTNAKLGFFRKNKLLDIKLNVTDRQIIKILKENNPEQIAIGTVRKGIGELIKKSSKISNTLVINHLTRLPINILYDTPHTLGIDRVAAATGAAYLFKNQNCLTIDLGTCITYDFTDSSSNYRGGGISPGIEMKLKAMHKFTSKLPNVTTKTNAQLIGKTTKECMLSGAINGTIVEIEGIIRLYQQSFDDLTIIFCGGDAIFFESKIKGHIFANPNLVLVGLNQILKYNLNE